MLRRRIGEGMACGACRVAVTARAIRSEVARGRKA